MDEPKGNSKEQIIKKYIYLTINLFLLNPEYMCFFNKVIISHNQFVVFLYQCLNPNNNHK